MKQIEKLLKIEFSQDNINGEKFSWFEEELGICISDEVKFFWTCCLSMTVDGSQCYVSPLVDIDYYTETINDLFYNFEELNEFVVQSNVSKEVKPYVFHKKWIPFISVDGIYDFFDFDPSKFGHMGQIIVSDMMGGESEVSMVSSSLDELCGRINKEVKAGNILTVMNEHDKSLMIESFDENYSFFEAVGLWENEK